MTHVEAETIFAQALAKSILTTPADWTTEDIETELDDDFSALDDLVDDDLVDDVDDVDAALEAALTEVSQDLDAARANAARIAREVDDAWTSHTAAQYTTPPVADRAAVRADLHATAHHVARTAEPASAPEVVRARLIWYIDQLAKVPAGNITSKCLAAYIGNTADQVRKDFNNYGAFGRRGVGYDVATLTSILKNLVATSAKVSS